MNFNGENVLNRFLKLGVGGVLLSFLGCQEVPYDGVYRKTALKINDIMVAEEDGYAVISYSLNRTSDEETGFTWYTESETAVEGLDYTPIEAQKVKIPAGMREGSLRIPLNNDRLPERDKKFKVMIMPVSLEGIEGTGSELEAMVTIMDTDPPPQLSIEDVTVDEGSRQATMTYNLDAPSGRDTSFSWSTVGGSALGGEDYMILKNQNVVIPEKIMTGQFTIVIEDDHWDEVNESFKVVIDPNSLSGFNKQGNDLEATVTVMDNDEAPSVSLWDVSVVEGSQKVFLTYDLSAVSGRETRFHWSTQNGTGTAGQDYRGVTHQEVVIPPKTLQGTLYVQISDDSFYEGLEQFQVVISSSSLVYLGESGSDLTAQVTLKDNEPIPSISIADVQVSEDDGTASVTYTLNPISVHGSSFHWSTQDGSARSGQDYTAKANVGVTIPAKQRTGTLVVNISNDLLDEAEEQLSVVIASSSLSGLQHVGSDLTATITIGDNDAPPTLTLTDVTVGEGESTALIAYELSAVSGRESGFRWSTQDDSALSREDYTAVTNQNVVIPAGTLGGSFSVAITDDLLDEANERLFVVAPTGSLSFIGATGGRLEAALVITDNDLAPTVTLGDVSVGEEEAEVLVTYTLSAVSGRESRFQWSTQNGTGIAGQDYGAVTDQEVVIPANTLQGTFQVSLMGDTFYEGLEQFQVVISSSSLVYLRESGSDLTAQVTLNDNESIPSISIADVQVSEDDGTASVTYTLNPISAHGSSFRWSTQNGSARSGQDYTVKANVSVTIPAKQQTGTLVVNISNDLLDEAEEQLSVVIASSSLSGLRQVGSDLTATITIGDNDAPPTLTLTDVTVGEGESTALIAYALSAVSGRESGFRWSTQDDSALSREDYRAVTNQNVVIPAGTLGGSFSVVITDDLLDEANERLFVVVPTGSLSFIGATGGRLEAALVITDNDLAPTVTLGDVSVGEEEAEVLVTYTLSAASGRESRFQWSTQNGTGTAGQDYRAVTDQEVMIPANILQGTFRVSLMGDTLYEGLEQFQVVISSSSLVYLGASGSDLTAQVTLNDNESIPSISIADVQVSEDGGTASVTYTLNPISAHGSSFRWSTQDGSAHSGQDYTAKANVSVTIPAKQGTGTLEVTILDDLLDEAEEQLSVVIASSSLSGLQQVGSDLTATIAIGDNDAPPTLTLTDAAVREDQGTVLIAYALSAVSGRESGFRWSTKDGSAHSGEDYTAVTNQNVVIPAGTLGGSFSVAITDDLLDEDNEGFSVVVAPDSLRLIAALGGRLEAAMVIRDNDDRPKITLSDLSLREGAGEALVTYTLSAVSGRSVSFSWSTQDGSALSDQGDYTAVSGQTVTLPPGSGSGTLSVMILDDNVDEGNENFKVVIDSTSLTHISPSGNDLKATVTIKDTVSESFTQAAVMNQIDILWVVDNSSSMQDEQTSLANNFEDFITDFVDVEVIDFRIAIITTESHINRVGPNDLTLGVAQNDKQDFIDLFKEKIAVGITGLGNERGFTFTKKFLKLYKTSWVRNGAYLVIIYVSDENDHSVTLSDNSVSHWVRAFAEESGTPQSLLKIYSIINTVSTSTGFGERYKLASQMAGGLVGDISGDFATVLEDFSDNIMRLARSFALSFEPEDVSSMEVRVNGALVSSSSWSYDVSTRTLEFRQGSAPSAGASIKISCSSSGGG